MKRICRQHGISRWPSRKINKVNRSLSKLKHVIESVQGAEGALGLTSLTSSPLPVTVGSISWPSNLNVANQQNSPCLKPYEPQGQKKDSPICRTPESDGQARVDEQLLGERPLSREDLVHEHKYNGLPELGKGCNRSRTGSGSREESAGTPTSHGSCEGSPANESVAAKDPVVSVHERCCRVGGSPDLAFQTAEEPNLSAAFSTPDPLLATEPQEPFGGMLVEDAGSSKDLRNLCPSVADAVVDERLAESSWINARCSNVPHREAMAVTHKALQIRGREEMRSATIKATYGDDIIRFRISVSSGIMELKEEVAKRLKLEVGTFDIKYLDDDSEWVLIACDADLQECLDISRTSGSSIVRLAVHDVMANLGSSCESTGELG